MLSDELPPKLCRTQVPLVQSIKQLGGRRHGRTLNHAIASEEDKLQDGQNKRRRDCSIRKRDNSRTRYTYEFCQIMKLTTFLTLASIEAQLCYFKLMEQETS